MVEESQEDTTNKHWPILWYGWGGNWEISIFTDEVCDMVEDGLRDTNSYQSYYMFQGGGIGIYQFFSDQVFYIFR